MSASGVLLFPETGDPWVHLSSASPTPTQPLHFVERSCVRKQAPRGFNHFAIKAELLSSLIQAELLAGGLGARLASPQSAPHTAPTSDGSRKMEHSSLILPLNQGT